MSITTLLLSLGHIYFTSGPENLNLHLNLIQHNAFLCFFNNIGYIRHHQIFARIARPKKTRTTSMHFRRFPTSITAPTSWSNIFSMHSLLICGFLILHSSFFFFGSKEVDVASPLVAHAAASLPSILLRSARTSIKFLSINKSMYSPSQNQNEHPSSYTHDDVRHELPQLKQRMSYQNEPNENNTYPIVFAFEEHPSGVLIRLRRIYNFLLFYANIPQFSYTFGNFLYYFWD